MPLSTLQELAARSFMPTRLTSAELAMIEPDLLERVIKSATVDDLRLLQGIRDGARSALAGEASPAEARRILRDALAYAGYQSPEGKEGTIQDLGSLARQRLIIDTNVSQISNYVHKQNLMSDGRLHAWQLVRIGVRKQPRDWETRWQDAYAQLTPDERQEVDYGSKTALVTSRIWPLLSRFGTGYPPFDFNSGMGVRDVPADGLTPSGQIAPEGLNDTLRHDASGLDPDLRSWVEDNINANVSAS